MVIKADIALGELAAAPAWTGGCITFGQSRITPHAHHLLETVLVHAADRWFVAVRERQASRPMAPSFVRHDVDDDAFHALYQECLLWPLDYLMIEVARAGHRMRVRAGAFGVAPVYCRATDERVMISWDSADFAGEPMALDAEVVSHRLALHSLYSARQPYVGVHLLTERATLHVEPGRATYRYPDAVPVAMPIDAMPDEEVMASFDNALQQAVSKRPVAVEHLALELSGGMDSGSVATALGKRFGRIVSKGILLQGDVRTPQVQRRAAIVERLGLVDDTVDITSFLPDLELLPQADRPYGFQREFYLEACAALWDAAKREGRDVMFTGIGGDELFPTYAHELTAGQKTEARWATDARHHAESLLTPAALAAARSLRTFDAPAGAVPTTSLLAQACRAPDLLRHGQWPVNPLSDPHLALFCHRLPAAYRHGRETIRRYLEAHLGDDVFPRGYVKETFVDVLPTVIGRHAKRLATQLQECALADVGLVDQRAVLALLALIIETRAHAATSAFASFLTLERCARQAAA